MSKSPSFDFNSLKRMTVDNLIEYVKPFLSEEDAFRLDDAYKASRFGEVKSILEKTLEQIKANKVSEYQKAKQAVKKEFPNADKLFDFSNTNEGSQNDNMGTGSVMVAVIVIIVAIIVVGAIIVLSRFKPWDSNKTVDEVLSNDGIKKGNSIKYTEKDKDLIELIHELSVIYDNTDQYLNS